jgi:hypothetical protein
VNNFENNFQFEKPGDKLIRNIFASQGRAGLAKKTEEVLNWSKKGGPKVGTPLFIKGVVGNVRLNPEEFSVLKREIDREIKRIKKTKEISEVNKIRMKPKENDEFKEISKKAREDLKEELKRSGGIDPNEL